MQLHRQLRLRDLVFYGIVLVQPIAPVGLFGIAQKMSHGHMLLALLVAMVAMLFTADSYGRMAAVYPSAGSAYTFVGKTFGRRPGFLVGWTMGLDYFVIPIVTAVYGSLTLSRLVPGVPYAVWALVFVSAITLLNLRGIRTTTRTNEILLFVMCAVVLVFFVLAVRHLGRAQLFSWQPFYDPQTFDFTALRTATSFAALTYIGFDGVTTLSEDVENPRRNVRRATMLVCLFTGVFGGMQVYLGQRVWPDFNSFPNVETAFLDVAGRVGGHAMLSAMAAILLAASMGTYLTGQVGAARLLYGMGRDDVIPARVFGHLDTKSGVPTYNVLLVGAVSLVGTLVFKYELAAELLNFGAFTAFMGVNAACARHVLASRAGVTALVSPVLGFVSCLAIWWSLPMPAKLAGGAWLAIGAIFLAARGLRAGSADSPGTP